MLIISDTRSIIPQIIVNAAILAKGFITIMIPKINVTKERININAQLGLSDDFKLNASWNLTILLIIIQQPMIIGRKALIIFGLNINTKPNIIYTIPSISSKLNALNSFGLEKYDIVCMIPTTSKKHPRQINNTDNETSGLNIKKSETTIRQIDNTIDPFAYLFI